MTIHAINSTGVPVSQLPFCPAVKDGPFVFVSGQASVGPTGKVIPGSFEAEVRRSFENVKQVLTSDGLGLKDVVQVRSYVARPEDLPEFNQIYLDIFEPPYHARTTLIGCLGTVVKFEVDVVAYPES